MFCRNCGQQLNDDAVFCNGCGTQLKTPDPAVQVTAPMPPVGPVPASEEVAAPKRSSTALIVALVVVGVLVVGGAVVGGLFVTGVLGGGGIAASRTDEGTAAGDKKDASNEETASADDASDGSTEAAVLSGAESYDALVEHYAKLNELADTIGRANSDGSYGGTGFAYDVFNPSIGSTNAGTRTSLVESCQELLDSVSGQKQGLDEAQVSSAYEAQKAKLLSLYGLLETRMNAMLGAAKAAVDDPNEAAWRPILSPASTDSREQFEAAYPGAAPVKQ